ncbi:MAG: NADH-quinone oxidoreductase subunit J [Bacteroidota bacterium]|nr:NADH-quinone oxidoreductase subunit J [Bacteroidota bacterium]MDP4233784.1 NADH-quinone oxidoreductase subunit J [Bacteroidota bacterium]MDP4242423.1 NADH-quinone oxidoreductase subunit J [Bacteroidota bacterium]MDP4287545.1 NADH-quinone oxidoreductase subunit J [Bacteroidota bacterium]
MMLSAVAFYVLSAGAIICALLTITRKSAVVSALMLVLTFCFLAAIYLTLSAQFLAVVQVAVYAGAIMVLVLFVIMLLNLESEEIQLGRNWKGMVSILAALGVLAQILGMIFLTGDRLPKTISPNAAMLGTTEAIGRTLYTGYSFPFEMASLILISAAVGAIILAKKRLT